MNTSGRRGVRLGQELASEEGREAGNSLLEGICPHVLVPLLGRCNLEELALRSQEPIIVGHCATGIAQVASAIRCVTLDQHYGCALRATPARTQDATHIIEGTRSLAVGICHRPSRLCSPRTPRPSALDGCSCPAHGYCATAGAARRARPSSFPPDTRVTTRSLDTFPYVPTLPFLGLHPHLTHPLALKYTNLSNKEKGPISAPLFSMKVSYKAAGTIMQLELLVLNCSLRWGSERGVNFLRQDAKNSQMLGYLTTTPKAVFLIGLGVAANLEANGGY
ncbi:hypothetical protein FB451DRAFT_1183953 [Mycena latifolia]|nr:hypothetical protein FB451DRAFT_1183953 [Mycena latifolia]